MTVGLFDILKDVSHSKQRLLVTEDDFNEYPTFMVNRFLSNHPDTIHLALYMDKYTNLPKEIQYEFYMNAIYPKNRFFKYQKQDKNADIDIISDYYNISIDKAGELLKVLSKKDIKDIKEKMKKGGVKRG